MKGAKVLFSTGSFSSWQQKSRRGLWMVMIASVLMLTYVLRSHSQEAPSPDQAQIGALMRSLSSNDHPQSLLDPEMRSEERNRQLQTVSRPYTLRLIPNESIKVSGDSATVEARVEFQTTHSQLEQSARVNFVRRNGRWYFADFSFLQTSWVFIIGFIAGMLLAIGYASGVLWAFFSRRKQGPLRPVDFVRIYNPLTWFTKKHEN
jgi:uncharacterized protein YchJ